MFLDHEHEQKFIHDGYIHTDLSTFVIIHHVYNVSISTHSTYAAQCHICFEVSEASYLIRKSYCFSLQGLFPYVCIVLKANPEIMLCQLQILKSVQVNSVASLTLR